MAVTLTAVLVVAVAPRVAAAEGLLAVPSSQTGTFTGELAGSDYYVLHLRSGQTITATCTVAPSGESFEMSTFMVSGNSWRIVSKPATAGVQILTVSGTSALGTALLHLFGSAGATYTLDVADASPTVFAFAGSHAPSTAKRRAYLAVSTHLLPAYDSYFSPVRFLIDRKTPHGWLGYSSVPAALPDWRDYSFESRYDPARTKLTAHLKLPRGTYRMRARLVDPAHPTPLYGDYRTVVVR